MFFEHHFLFVILVLNTNLLLRLNLYIENMAIAFCYKKILRLQLNLYCTGYMVIALTLSILFNLNAFQRKHL